MMAKYDIIDAYCEISLKSGESLKECLTGLWDSCQKALEENPLYKGVEETMLDVIREYAKEDEGCLDLLNSIELQKVFKGSR